MGQDEREVLEKEVVTKEDGRSLTFYRFRPAAPTKAPAADEGDKQ